ADPGLFASKANAAFVGLLASIRQMQAASSEQWIAVNAWAIYDRGTEWPPGDYTQNRHLGLSVHFSDGMRKQYGLELGHPLILTVGSLVAQGVDVVFGAGNCGQFSTSPRCGALDRGLGRTIWGANAHPDVVTVAATSVGADWMGYSSEGPAVWNVE